MPHAADYDCLLGLFIRLVEAQAGKTIAYKQSWLNDAQVLAVKLFRHLVSMRMVASDTRLDFDSGKSLDFIDHASVKVLGRAALETYLVFYYIYGDNDQSVREFRHMTWHLGGLSDRQKFSVSSEEGRSVQASEKLTIEQLRSSIAKSPHFQAYSDKQRKKLLLGDWRVNISWVELGTRAGFHQKYFSNVYSYLCGYSHSSYMSALQVSQAQSKADQEMLAGAILSVGLVIMAHFAFAYSRLFPAAQAALTADTHAQKTAEMWRFGPDDMSAFYDRESRSEQK